jgi:MOSC domain-containing protein YiiM
MEALSAAVLSRPAGLEGDARGKPGKRQITILDQAAWEAACQELGRSDLSWLLRRANLLVSGLSLRASTGRLLRIGPVLLEITGETEPCVKIDRPTPGLMKALTPDCRGGVTARVREGGRIEAGMGVAFETDLFG